MGHLLCPALLGAINFLRRSVGLTLSPFCWESLPAVGHMHSSLVHTRMQLLQGSVGAPFVPRPVGSHQFSPEVRGAYLAPALLGVAVCSMSHAHITSSCSHVNNLMMPHAHITSSCSHAVAPGVRWGTFCPPPCWEPSIFSGGPWGFLCPRSVGSRSLQLVICTAH